MNLDNNFYLVRFGEKEDLERVVTGGPWIVSGHYLSVQPWSSSFSIDKDVIGNQVVWIRLPALPECFYSECLINEIGRLIDPMIKIDLKIA